MAIDGTRYCTYLSGASFRGAVILPGGIKRVCSLKTPITSLPESIG